jgi:glycosyltransferase involved in cell wall biosynthesis
MKMKVLIVTSSFPNTRNSISGNFILDQINNITAFYDDIEFIVCCPGITINRVLENKKIKIYNFRYFLFKKSEVIGIESITDLIKKSKFYYIILLFFTISQLLKLVSVVSKEKPDLIYAHWFTPQAITSFIVSKIYKIPFKITIHSRDLKILDYKLGKLGRRISNIILKSSSGVTVTSKNILKTVESVLNKAEINKLNLIQYPMGIDSINIERTNKDSEILKTLDSKTKYILYLGRLVKNKGLEDLIYGFGAFSKKSDYKLIIAGFGNLEVKLKTLVQEQNLENKIIFTGKVNISEKKSIFEKSKILIVPSRKETELPTEGMPVTILEGIYFGKIVIASSNTNCDDVIKNGVNGYIYENTGPANITKVLEKVTTLNSEQINKLTFNALASSKMYDSKGSSEIYYNFLKKC